MRAEARERPAFEMGLQTFATFQAIDGGDDRRKRDGGSLLEMLKLGAVGDALDGSAEGRPEFYLPGHGALHDGSGGSGFEEKGVREFYRLGHCVSE